MTVEAIAIATAIFEANGLSAEGMRAVGSGESFLCVGTGDFVVLLARQSSPTAFDKVRVTKACTDLARAKGVRAPQVHQIGHTPAVFALCDAVRASIVDRDDPAARLPVYEDLGVQLAALHAVPISGAGPLRVVDDELRGSHSSWLAYCEWFAEELIPDTPMAGSPLERLRAFEVLSQREWRAFRNLVLDHGDQSKVVLCHYDNRIPNLPRGQDGVWVLDWDLARAAPLGHELIKVYERPPPHATNEAHAILAGCGVPQMCYEDMIRDAHIGLAMDLVELSVEWVDIPAHHEHIAGLLSAVRRISLEYGLG
jgi:hypothetical protein